MMIILLLMNGMNMQFLTECVLKPLYEMLYMLRIHYVKQTKTRANKY